MNRNPDVSVSMEKAADNFPEAARLADENGAVVITKNDVPRYLLVEYSAAQEQQTAGEDELLSASGRLIRQNIEAYEVLAE